MDVRSGSGRPARSGGARERLEQELATLRARHQVLLEAAFATDGVEDRADQAQRLERADDLARLTERIHELAELLTRPGPATADTLPDGTEVTVRFGDGDVVTMQIVTIPDDAVDTVTRDSPLGRALRGAAAGDTITYTGPDGPIVAEVLSIQPPTA
jgi:transcription elongation factor GreA